MFNMVLLNFLEHGVVLISGIFFPDLYFRTLCQNLSNLNVKPNMFTLEVACEDTLKVERTMEDASLFL